MAALIIPPSDGACLAFAILCTPGCSEKSMLCRRGRHYPVIAVVHHESTRPSNDGSGTYMARHGGTVANKSTGVAPRRRPSPSSQHHVAQNSQIDGRSLLRTLHMYMAVLQPDASWARRVFGAGALGLLGACTRTRQSLGAISNASQPGKRSNSNEQGAAEISGKAWMKRPGRGL